MVTQEDKTTHSNSTTNNHKDLVDFVNSTYYGGKEEGKVRRKLLKEPEMFEQALTFLHKSKYADKDYNEFRTRYVDKFGDPFKQPEPSPEPEVESEKKKSLEELLSVPSDPGSQVDPISPDSIPASQNNAPLVPPIQSDATNRFSPTPELSEEQLMANQEMAANQPEDVSVFTQEGFEKVASRIKPLAAVLRGIQMGRQADLLTAGDKTLSEEDLKELANVQKKLQDPRFKPSKEYERFTQAKGFLEGLKEFSENYEKIIPELTAESMTALLNHGISRVLAGANMGAAAGTAAFPGPGTMIGAGAGAVSGLGLSSLNLEYSGSIMESLQQAGIDVSDPDSLIKGFGDDSIMEEARSHALKKGVPIALFDMLSAGLAGKIVSQPAKTLIGRAGQYSSELGMQAGMGMSGEFTGQSMAGEEIQPGAILAEGVGELGPGVVETGIGKKVHSTPEKKITAPEGPLGKETTKPKTDEKVEKPENPAPDSGDQPGVEQENGSKGTSAGMGGESNKQDGKGPSVQPDETKVEPKPKKDEQSEQSNDAGTSEDGSRESQKIDDTTDTSTKPNDGKSPKKPEPEAQSSLQKESSWVIVDKETRKAVKETFDKSEAEKVDTEKFDVLPAQEYLGKLNKEIKEKQSTPTKEVEKTKEVIEDKVDELKEDATELSKDPKVQNTKLKEQKRDILEQMDEVENALWGDVSKEEREKATEAFFKGKSNMPFDEEGLKRVKDLGYEVSEGGIITFHVKDDGVFRLNYETLPDAIKETKKQFPDQISKRPEPKLTRAEKSGGDRMTDAEKAKIRGSIEESEKRLNFAKENLEEAKKDGNKGLIKFFTQEVEKEQKIYDEAVWQNLPEKSPSRNQTENKEKAIRGLIDQMNTDNIQQKRIDTKSEEKSNEFVDDVNKYGKGELSAKVNPVNKNEVILSRILQKEENKPSDDKPKFGEDYIEKLDAQRAEIRKKLGGKKGEKYLNQVDDLLNPYKNHIIEYRPNGVVVKEGDAYKFKWIGDMDFKKWRITSRDTDVTDQFTSEPKVNLPQEEKKPTSEPIKEEKSQEKAPDYTPESAYKDYKALREEGDNRGEAIAKIASKYKQKYMKVDDELFRLERKEASEAKKVIDEIDKKIDDDDQSLNELGIVDIGFRQGMSVDFFGDVWDKVKSIWGKYSRARGHLPKDAFQDYVKMKADINATMTKIGYTAKDFRVQVNKHYGRNPTNKEIAKLDAYLKVTNTRAKEMIDIPQDVKNQLDVMRGQIDELSRRLIDEGIVQGDMEATIANNLGVYMTRSYRTHDAPEKWQKYIKNNPQGQKLYNRAFNFVRSQVPEYTDQDIDGILNEILDNPESVFPIKQGGKAGSMDKGILTRRKDIAPEIRALMGEYTDPMVNWSKSVAKMSNLIAKHHFLQVLSEKGTGKYIFDKPVGKYHREISGKSNYNYHPLNGKYTSPEIEEALESFTGNKTTEGWLQLYLTINSYVKQAKTILSLQTHARNFFSNPFFMMANGHFNVAKFSEATRTTLNNLTKGSNAELREKYQRYVKLGIVSDNAYSGELKDIINDANEKDFDIHAMQGNWINKARKNMVKGITDLYQAEDDFYKIAAFENERSRYKKALGDTVTDEELDTRVAQIIRDTYPTYSLVPRGVKSLRKVPFVGTFVSFPAEVIRTLKNTTIQTYSELNDPKLRSIGIQRLSGMMLTAAVYGAIRLYGMYNSGVDDEDDYLLEGFLAPWEKNGMRFYTGKSKGNVEYIDMSFSIPHAYVWKPIDAIYDGLTKGDTEENFKKSLEHIFDPFLGEEILSSKLIDVARNTKKSTGGPVYNPQDKTANKLVNIYDHLAEAFEPGTVRSARRIQMAATGEVTEYGRGYDLKEEIGALIVGLRNQNIDIAKSMGFRINQFSKDLSDAKYIWNSVKNKNVSKAELDEAKERSIEVEKELIENMRRLYKTAKRFGVSENTLQKLFIDHRISGQHIHYIMNPNVDIQLFRN